MDTPKISPLGSKSVIEAQFAKESVKAKSLDSDFFSAAFNEATMTDEVVDLYRDSLTKADPTFIVTKEMKSNHISNWGTEQAKYLEDAVSDSVSWSALRSSNLASLYL